MSALAPDRRRLLTDVRVVRLLKVAPASCERREHRVGNLGFEHGLGDPFARPNVNEINFGARIVVTKRSVDTAEPEEAVGVAGPHERSVGHIGEPRDASAESIVAACLAEADDTVGQRTGDGRSSVDVVATGPHRRAVNIGHPRYSAPEMETFKRYLMFQAMTFIFGIVGPIFLILFFASPRDPSLRWAYWWGLFITVADILIALWLAGSASPQRAPKDVRLGDAAVSGDSGSSSDSG